MATRVVEREIEAADGGSVTIRREGSSGRVTVTWFCGDTRQFNKDDLADAVKNVSAMVKREMGDVWLSLSDSYGQKVACRVVDGEFYADTSPRSDSLDENVRHVPWDDLRKALKKSIE